MKQFLKEQWKRVTAVILAFTLIASGLQIGMVSNAAGETELKITGVVGFAHTNAWDMKLGTSAALPGNGAAWSTYYHGPDVIIAGQNYDIGLQKQGATQVGIYIGSDDVTIPVADGTVITIRAGIYEGTDGSAIKITEDYSIEFDSSLGSQGWDQWKPHVEATEMTIAGVAGFAQTNAWDMKLSTSVNLPGAGAAWSTYFHGPDVIVGGTSFDIGLQKTGANQVGVYLTSEQVTIPVADGTTITIKAGTYEGTDGSAIKITEDYSIEFDSSLGSQGWDQWKPHEEIQYDDVTIKALKVKDFNTDSVRWNVYVDVTGAIPGTAWDGQFTGLKYKINEQEYSVEAAYKDDEDTIFFYIPESILPKDFTGNKTIVVEAGYGLHSTAGVKGIRLTEDFTIYANEYGWSTEAFIVPPSYTSNVCLCICHTFMHCNSLSSRTSSCKRLNGYSRIVILFFGILCYYSKILKPCFIYKRGTFHWVGIERVTIVSECSHCI